MVALAKAMENVGVAAFSARVVFMLVFMLVALTS